jgi:hypothetical protein
LFFTRNIRRRLLLLVMPVLAVAAIGPATALAIPAQTVVDTGWQNYDGGCQARTQLRYYTASNRITMKTDVYDPYWFAACRVNSKPIFDTNFGPVSDGPSQYMMACAVFDPTCASTRYGAWETYDPASATLAVLKSYGVDLGSAISQIRVQHTSAAGAGAAAAKSAKASRVAGAKRATKAQIHAKETRFGAHR